MIAVIGAGLGGLSAAVHLAAAGHEVTVLEQHDRPGGCASSWTRGPWTFEVSLHYLDAVGPGQPNRVLLDELGITDAVELVRGETLRREVWPELGLDLWLPQDLGACLELLRATFPGADFAGLFARARRAADAAAHLLAGGSVPDEIQRELVALRRSTAADVLAAHLGDPGARRVAGSLCTYLALPAHRLSALPFLWMLHGYHAHGAYRLAGGSAALTAALVARLEALGSRLLCGHRVDGLIVRRRRVEAVRSGALELEVRAVVANVSPLALFGPLVPDDELDPSWLRRLRARRLAPSFHRLAVGLDCPPGELAPTAFETSLHLGGADPYRERLAVTAPTDGCDPSLGVLALTTAAPCTDEAMPEDRRASITSELLDATERHLLPGLRRHVQLAELAHPGTWARYLGVPRGAVMGFAADPSQVVGQLRARTPLRNLVLAGGWVFPGPGQTAALRSGRLAARALLRS